MGGARAGRAPPRSANANVSNYFCQLVVLIFYSGVTSQTYVSALVFFLCVFMSYRPHTLHTFNFLQSKNVMARVVSKFRKNEKKCTREILQSLQHDHLLVQEVEAIRGFLKCDLIFLVLN